MKKSKLVVVLAVLLMVSAIFIGCADTAKTETAKEDTTMEDTTMEDTTKEDTTKEDTDKEEVESTYTVAWCNNSSTDEYLVYMTEIFEENAADFGFELIVYDAQGDTQTQVSHVENAVAQGADAIIINPNDASGLGPALKGAKEAGLVIITTVADVTAEYQEFRDSFVGPNDTEAGRLAAELFLEYLPEGKIIAAEGMAGYDAQIKRHDAFFETIEGSDIEVLDITTTTFWDPAEALANMEDSIVKYGDQMEGVFCHWDYGCEGVVEALDAANLTQDLFIVSVDGCRVGFDLVKEGKIYATIAQDVPTISMTTLETLKTILTGGTAESFTYVPLTVITAAEATYDPGW